MIGENPLMGTMYGNTMREIGRLLNEDPDCDVFCMAFNYTGWPFNTQIIPYPLYPWVGTPNKPVNLDDVLYDCKPDTLLLIGPPYMFGWLPGFKKRKHYKIILSTTFKSLPLDTFLKDLFSASDIGIVHSRFEQEALGTVSAGCEIRYVQPGINTHNLKNFFHKSRRMTGDSGLRVLRKTRHTWTFRSC